VLVRALMLAERVSGVALVAGSATHTIPWK
jgi:hypothetical protein